MTEALRFTVLVDTEMPATDLAGKPLLSRERGADRLAAALAAVGHDAISSEAPLASVTADRWLLYFGADPAEALARCGSQRRSVASRLIVLDEDRVTAAEMIEELSVPLVVTYRSFQNWLRDERTPAQVLGRTAIARALGVQLSPADASDRHALFLIPDVPLPEGIARYCAAMPESRR